MSEKNSSYNQVLKATSIFGGVQFFGMIISIIKSKCIAVLLGAHGMGVISLLNATVDLISEFIKVGLDTSAVKSLAYAKMNTNENEIQHIIGVLQKLLLISGFFGVILMVSLSPVLSKLVFENDTYVNAFICISVALLFKQLSIGQLSVFQGLRKMNYLAKISLFSNLIGLCIAVPMYYFYGAKAIVPVIIANAFVIFIIGKYFFNKAKIKSIKKTYSEAFVEGKQMLKLGGMISLKGGVTLLTLYVLQLYIGHFGGVKELGLYSAGFVIINSYVGLIFNAMQMDYFPRLSEVVNNKVQLRKVVQEQSFIAILIVTPIIVLFIIAVPYIIQILYTKEFLGILDLVTWAILGTLFKTVSWTIGYVLIAKGDSKLFMKTTLFFNTLLLIMTISGYYIGGLLGVGISFFIYYIIHFLVLRIITQLKYELYFDKKFMQAFGASILFCLSVFLSVLINGDIVKYITMFSLLLLSLTYSIYHLDKNTGVLSKLIKLLRKK